MVKKLVITAAVFTLFFLFLHFSVSKIYSTNESENKKERWEKAFA